MPARTTDPSIGERIRARREYRGWSVRLLADRAGMTHSALSMIERGQRSADNRYVIARIAGALGCTVAELTGAPHVPGDRELETVSASRDLLRRAMVDDSLDVPAGREPRRLEALRADLDLIRDRHRRCDYAAVVRLLPDLLIDLRAQPADRVVLELGVHAYRVAMSTLRHLGYLTDAWWAAAQCRHLAEQLDDPTALAVADYVRSRAAAYCGAYDASALVASRAAVAVERHTRHPGALELLGALRITGAMSAAASRPDDALAMLNEAAAIADRTGETDLHDLWFGPTLVGLGRLIVEVDTGEPGRALEVAAAINPAAIPAATRQVHYWIDRSRALKDLRQGQAAADALLTAERIAPQHVRTSAVARETVRWLSRDRRVHLHGLPERMGLNEA